MSQKKSDPTDIWAWVSEDTDRLHEKGGAWQTILDGYYTFNDLMHTDPLGAELAISQALNAARETGELKWQLHLRHWRLQLWLENRQAKRVLPEAIDLLSLATDDRVRDVPQRICAYHDVVDCYVDIDPAGYYQEIVENSTDTLSQLPKKHPCATCARIHIAQAAASSGREQEAEHWLNQLRANLPQPMYSGLQHSIAQAKVSLGKWEDAELAFQEAIKLAQKSNKVSIYLNSVLGLARVALEQQKFPLAFEQLEEGRRTIKYLSGNSYQALLAETEGRFLIAQKKQAAAISYLTQAAQLYLDLGCYRDAALAALYGAEIAHTAHIPAEEILTLAAKAVGQMPQTSSDVYKRLAALGQEPILVADEPPKETAPSSVEEQDQRELIVLQNMLQLHLANGNIRDATVTLFHLGHWHDRHKEYRAAIDYLISNAALERLIKLSIGDREDALDALRALQTQLPPGTVEAALTASESAPPEWLKDLISDMSPTHWAWIIRCIATELAGKPVVEPEPLSPEGDFTLWLERVASMTVLLVRFKDKISPPEVQSWISSLEETRTGIQQQNRLLLETHTGEEAQHILAEGAAILALIEACLALARGATIEEATSIVTSPFLDLIRQIGQIARTPVWQHPDWSPLDYLVEHAAQEAVFALRGQDEHRTSRLQNLALRYKLMNLDMQPEEPLQPIVELLAALQTLLLSDGKDLPTLVVPEDGDTTFQTILNAVYEAAQEKA